MKIPSAKPVFDEEMKDAALDSLQSETSVFEKVFSGNNAVEDHLRSMIGGCWGGRGLGGGLQWIPVGTRFGQGFEKLSVSL